MLIRTLKTSYYLMVHNPKRLVFGLNDKTVINVKHSFSDSVTLISKIPAFDFAFARWLRAIAYLDILYGAPDHKRGHRQTSSESLS